MSQLISLTIRTLHVLAMVVVVGGTAAVWYGSRHRSTIDLTLARQYEWAFWAALGVLVLTGVGNLGALGVPGPATDWGQILLVKLLVVGAIVCGSAVRTLAVVRAGERVNDMDDPAALQQTLAHTYGITVSVLLAIVVLAEVLAHG